MGGGVVFVMAKAPVPGLVKTRLCPPLTSSQASRLAEAFALDTIRKLAAVAVAGGLEVRVALDGAGQGFGRGLEEEAARLGLPVEGQGQGDLGTRMEEVLGRGLATGRPTVLVGTDAPDLPGALVRSAFEALARVDAVLVPAADGGYVLVGARRPLPELFRIDAPWSSDGVFAATCEALRRAGYPFEVLEGWDDVDDAAALGRLASRLDGGADVAPCTARLLGEWRCEGVRF
ncbi:MAG: TIGR04282 family arsenosugar biosynthesis glycosyltransferase [Candidatus Binatia bacterium]